MLIRPVMSVGCQLLKFGFHSSTGTVDRQKPNPHDDFIPKNGFQVLQKDTPELKEMHMHLKGKVPIVRYFYQMLRKEGEESLHR